MTESASQLRILSLFLKWLVHDRWVATTWVVALVAAVYASAQATPWLYPTAAQRVDTAEAINASPAIVALCGPILDPRSVGELAMAKMTVLYAVLVAIMCAVIVRRHVRWDESSAELRTQAVLAAMTEAAALSVLVGGLSAAACVTAGLPLFGSLAFGASWCGIGLVATALTATVSQLPRSASDCGRLTAAAIGLLFALRAVGDSVGPPWLSWLSPFGWSTRLGAWSEPHWGAAALYVVVSVGLGIAALDLSGQQRLARRPGPTDSPGARKPLTSIIHRDGVALGLWTIAAGGMAAYFGSMSSSVVGLLGSSNAHELIRRLGGDGPIREALIGAELAIAAATVTAFGILAIQYAGAEQPSNTSGPPHIVHARRIRRYFGVVAVALLGSTWLLLVTGVMFTAGAAAAGEPLTAAYIGAAVNHAPAVWTLVGMTAVIWSIRPRWTAAGWVLLALFTLLSHGGRMIGWAHWLVNLSPYARISLMPSQAFDWRSTVALTAGSAILIAIAAYNYARQDKRLGTCPVCGDDLSATYTHHAA